jgi:hypothetical protein
VITTNGQLEATISEVLMKVEKVIAATNPDPNLYNAKRHLQELHRTVVKKQKPSPEHIKNLEKAAKHLRNVPMRMPELVALVLGTEQQQRERIGLARWWAALGQIDSSVERSAGCEHAS